MTVYKSHYLTLSVLLLQLCVAIGSVSAQGPSGGYKLLNTARGNTVTDTIEGVDLQVITIEPSAKHGDVIIEFAGIGSTPNTHRFSVQYTPQPGFEGVDTFTLELNQFFTFPYLHYLAYRVAVYPSEIILKNDYATTFTGVPITVNVLGNDNSSGGPLTLSEIAVANHGTASINAQNQVVFTPQSGFNGIALVNYVACDPAGFCKTGQLSVGVRPVGQIGNTTLQMATAKNTPTQGTLQYGGYLIWQLPQNGSLQVMAGRAFSYTPNPGFTGPDPFILRRNINGIISFLTVDMKVLPVAPKNKMAITDYIYTPIGTPVTFNVRSNDLGNLFVSQWGEPASGGTLSNTTPDGLVTFSPDPEFTGAAVFQYALGNGIANAVEIGTVNVIVSNLQPAYDTFNLTTTEGAPFVVDYPIPYHVFDFEISQLPAHGTCSFYPGYSTQVLGGQEVSGENLLIYQPSAGFTGMDEFVVNYCLAANSMCTSTVVKMEVADVPEAAPCLQDCVWPGDANADGIVNNKDLLTLGFCMGEEGLARPSGSGTWHGQQGNKWNNPFVPLTTDLKHADADGSGHITQADADIIEQNYGRTDNLIPGSPFTKKGLPFFFTLLTPNASVGDLVEVEVSLGSASEPVTNLYGLTFDAVLSPNIIDSAFRMEFYNNSWINFNSPFLKLSASPMPGRLESGFTRTNGQPVSGFGVIGKFSFVIIDIVDVGRPDDFLYFNLTLSNSNVQWGDGVLTNGSNYELKIPLVNSIQNRNSENTVASSDLLAYPSPASHNMYVTLTNGDLLESITVYDLNGRMVQQRNGISTDHITLDVSQLPNGLYVLSAQTTQGTVVRKAIIER